MVFDKPARNASLGTYFQRGFLPGRFASPVKLPGPGALSNRSIFAKTHGAAVKSHTVIIENSPCQPLRGLLDGPSCVMRDFCRGLDSAHCRRTLRNAPSTFKPRNKEGLSDAGSANLPLSAVQG